MYDPEKLIAELQAAGLPVRTVVSTGYCTFERDLTPEEQVTFEQVLANHDPDPTVAELRERGYTEAGCTDHELIIALWELVVEGRPEAAQALQAKRTTVKQEYPKPPAG